MDRTPGLLEEVALLRAALAAVGDLLREEAGERERVHARSGRPWPARALALRALAEADRLLDRHPAARPPREAL